jgi:outer membrane lipoprotein-sorting protein
MKLLYSFLVTLFAVNMSARSESATVPNGDLPSVDTVIQRALEAAAEREDQRQEASYTFHMASTSEKLDKNGEPKKVETRRFLNVPYKGHSYSRLIEIDGGPLDDKEKRNEEKREREFREKIDKGESPDLSEEEQMSFDEELISRYNLELRGLEEIDGRWAYAVAYAPKSGKLPVRRRIDRALNKSKGTIWIDRDTYAVAKLDFELMDKIRIWWGFIGSISQMRGVLNFMPVDEDAWMPSQFEFYLNGRIFFKSLHQNQTLTWSGFEKLSQPSDSE